MPNSLESVSIASAIDGASEIEYTYCMDFEYCDEISSYIEDNDDCDIAISGDNDYIEFNIVPSCDKEAIILQCACIAWCQFQSISYQSDASMDVCNSSLGVNGWVREYVNMVRPVLCENIKLPMEMIEIILSFI